MSTRREVILSWLCEKRQTWRLCYLLGEAGSGKTWLAQQLQKDKHRRVITLSLVVSWQGKAAWIVTDDNAAEQGCRDSAWTRDEMAGQLLHALHRTDSRCPLIIIENAHLNHRRILDDLQRAISLIPDGQFLLIGRPDRKVERDFKKQGIELVSIGRLTEHELKASILEGQNIDQPDLLLTARVLKRIALLCRGDRRKLALAGETIRLLQQAEQTSVFTAKQWRMIYRILGDNRPRKMQLAVVMSGTIIALTCGWLLLSSFTATLPVPAWLIPVTPVVKQDMNPKRRLIGDDEHGWDDDGVFNFEGGCYAKTIKLSKEAEPEIYNAIRRDALLENVTVREDGTIDFDDGSKTENTRVSYPIYHIDNIVKPVSKAGHATKVIFLTADAFGVLPPVSRLTADQTQYHFLSGFTAKLAGTERGITEPTPTFSACFGAAFLSLHPTQYAEVLVKRMQAAGAQAYLVNTGWNGTGKRISIKDTRAIIDAILNGSLDNAETFTLPMFNLAIPTELPGVDTKILDPRNTYASPEQWQEKAETLAKLFIDNFDKYTDTPAGAALVAAGPKL